MCGILVPKYQDVKRPGFRYHRAMAYQVERVQTGVRLEKRLLKVLKGLAEYLDLSLGDLLEGVVLHAFEGRAPFGPETRRKIDQLKGIYGLDLTAAASHELVEKRPPARRARPRRA
jgi:hypothetical protein